MLMTCQYFFITTAAKGCVIVLETASNSGVPRFIHPPIIGGSACLEKWVVRATRPLRSATRRPKLSRAILGKDRPHWLEAVALVPSGESPDGTGGSPMLPKGIFQTGSKRRAPLPTNFGVQHSCADGNP